MIGAIAICVSGIMTGHAVATAALVVMGNAIFLYQYNNRSKSSSERDRDPYEPLWRIAVLAVYVQAFDIRNLLRNPSNLRFLIVGTLVVSAWIFAVKVRSHTALSRSNRDRLLAALVVYMLIGSLLGRFFLATASSALSAALPLLIAIVPLPRRKEGFRPTTMLQAFARGLSVIVVMTFVIRLTPYFPAGRGALGHEKAHLLTAAVFGLWATRRWALLAATLLLAVAIFREYPAATYIVAGGAAFLTVAMTSQRRFPRRVGIALGLVGPLLLVIAATNLAATVALTGDYFAATGKSNNAYFRSQLYGLAWQRIETSPFVGSLYTGETTVVLPSNIVVNVEGERVRELAPHSDWLEVWMMGGVLALGLLVTWLSAVNLAVVRFCRGVHRVSERRLAQLLLIIVNGFFAVGLVNPVLDQIGNTLIMAASYMCLRLVLSSKHQGSPKTEGHLNPSAKTAEAPVPRVLSQAPLA